jgi:hypothetical protein
MYVIFLIVTTTALVATAAYFSVFGIASMFSYNYIPAMFMGITLEASKIGVAVYLFRYWRFMTQSLMTRVFKAILIVFLAALMFITSVGIFGFLSQGYQKTAEEFSIMSLELKNLEDEYTEKKVRMLAINSQIEGLPAENTQNRIRLSREYSDELGAIRDRLAALEPKIQALRVKRLAYESHIGPIAYVSRMLNVPQDNMVFYVILMLVFVADPLAITLTIACNMVLLRFWEKIKPQTDQAVKTPAFMNSLLEKAHTVARQVHRDTAKPDPVPSNTFLARAAAKESLHGAETVNPIPSPAGLTHAVVSEAYQGGVWAKKSRAAETRTKTRPRAKVKAKTTMKK